MTSLVRGFQAHSSDDDGLFVSEMVFQRGINKLGEEFGMTINEYKAAFLREAPKVCREIGIVVGYNELENGFQLGFENKADYLPFSKLVETALVKIAENHVRLRPHEAALLKAAFADHGVASHEFDELSECVSKTHHTPAYEG